MKALKISLLLLLSVCQIHAQDNIEQLLQEIEENSTQLAAVREETEAQRLENRSDLNPHDPEVEFNYFWGTPSAIGNRTDFSITQSFDFPTAYLHKKKIADLSNENLSFAYQAKRKNVLFEAKQICIELVYYNAMHQEYNQRLEHAQSIANMYEVQYTMGSANILEKNKAKLNLIQVENEIKNIEIEQSRLLSKLQVLNGGKAIAWNAVNLHPSRLPNNFTDWYAEASADNPILQSMHQQKTIANQQVKLNTAMNLPKLTTGYMSEKMVGEHFRGFTLGVSIPLWENRNKLKQAKAMVRSSEASIKDIEIEWYNHLEHLFLKAQSLKYNILQYQRALADFNNENYLKQALDAGEISLLNYLLEIEFYYDTKQKALEISRDYEMVIAELMRY
jgi:cobalt-zinc-cadmium efflux system outer membrane protein